MAELDPRVAVLRRWLADTCISYEELFELAKSNPGAPEVDEDGKLTLTFDPMLWANIKAAADASNQDPFEWLGEAFLAISNAPPLNHAGLPSAIVARRPRAVSSRRSKQHFARPRRSPDVSGRPALRPSL